MLAALAGLAWLFTMFIMHVKLEPHAMATVGLLGSRGLIVSPSQPVSGSSVGGRNTISGENLSAEPFLRGSVLDLPIVATGSTEKPSETSAVLSTALTAREASFQEETQRILTLQAEIAALKAQPSSQAALGQEQPAASLASIRPPPPPPPPPAVQQPASMAAAGPIKASILSKTTGAEAPQFATSSSSALPKDTPKKVEEEGRQKLASGCEVIQGVDYRAAAAPAKNWWKT